MDETLTPPQHAKKLVSDAIGIRLLVDKFQKTRKQEWPQMSPLARAGAICANGLSFARLARELVKFGQSDETRGWSDTIGDAVSATSDGLDGEVARRTGGKTAFGGVADQLVGDKMARWTKEISMARRGRMSPIHPAIRLARDLVVTAYREKTTRETAGGVSVDASPKNDPWSGKYSTTDYLVSNTLLDSPLSAKMPRWLRESIATVTDVHIIATGVANIYRLSKATKSNS